MDKEQKAIERIKTASEMSLHHYGQPLVCTYSGGKDSDVMLELFKRSGVPFEVRNSHTTVDAPPTVYHIRKKFRELELQGIKCNIDYHDQPDGSRVTMWNLIVKKGMPPTRRVRYCCSELKESSNAGRMIATGVRWAESISRREREAYEVLGASKRERVNVSDEMILVNDNYERRKLFEKCELKAETVVNPIIDWEDRDIWEFIRGENVEYNPLYDCGYSRVGCIGCPMASKMRWKEFSDFPRYKQAYIHVFARMLEARKVKGLGSRWKTGYDVFMWWMEDKNIDGQITLDEYMKSRKD